MSISRRHFLLGTAGAAAGLILPSYYRRALEFLDHTGEPLLEAVGHPTTELVAYQDCHGFLEYRLSLGHPYEEGPPPMTLRQFADRYELDKFHLGFEDDEQPDWDSEVDWGRDFYLDTWMYNDDPDMLAYELLSGLDLGPELTGENAVGQLQLEAGSTMVSSYWNVGTYDTISLSLLQQRLNDLRTGIVITGV